MATNGFQGTNNAFQLTGNAFQQADATLVEVPDVVGQTQANGTTTLETALFVVAVENAYSSTVPAGTIISQSPTAGSMAAEGSTVTITVSLGPKKDGAGRPRRRKYVEIDGQIFEVENIEHAKALLDQAKAIALKNAEKLVSPQVKRGIVSPPKNKPIRVQAPEISTSINELQSLVFKMRDEIKAIYRKAAVDAEIRLRMEMIEREQDDEGDDEFLLLL